MKIYKVGGAVRDEILGLEPKDTDWLVVGSSVAEMLKLGYKKVGKDFPVFLHPETNEEYALARKELKSGYGYKDFEFIFTPDITIEEDLSRRDLTINAIAKDSNDMLIDPFNGQSDIKNRIFRHISDAFYEDPLRALRVARFKSQMPNFDIHESTKVALRKISESDELKFLSNDRVWREVEKSLHSKFEEFLYVIKEYNLSHPWLTSIDNIPSFISDKPEIKWCQVSEINKFNFALKLDIPKSYDRQLALWKKFCNYKPDRDISYKIDFYSAFSRNNLEETKYTLNFFSSLQEKCLPVIEEYSNFNFGELFSKENKSPETVKIEKLKEIIEKHEK